MINIFIVALLSGVSFAGENPPMSTRTISPENIMFKPGEGLVITSDDGDFKMSTRLRAQMLYTFEEAISDENEEGEWVQGFQIRRARLMFKGNVFGKNNGYKFELAVSPKDIGLKSSGTISKSPLLDWYFHFGQVRDLNVRLGQYKVPYSRQRVVSSGNLQMVDRSIANGEFNLDRDLGLDIRSKNFLGLDKLRYYAGIYMGEGHSSYETGDLGMMYLGRVELMPMGMFKDYSEGDMNRSAKPKLSIGAAFGYLQDGKRDSGIVGDKPADGGTTDTMNFTSDLSFRVSGLSLESAFFWREGNRNAGEVLDENGEVIPPDEPRNGTGYYIQGGYLMPKNTVEFTTRYGEILPSSGDTSLEQVREAGLGVNKYFGEHPFKLQADAFRHWADEGFSEGLSEFRLQMQMSY